MPRKSPADLHWVTEGDKVEVMDSHGHWYVCNVIEVENPDKPTSIYVSYPDWPKSWNEWVSEPARVRAVRDREQTLLENAEKMHGSTAGAVVEDGEVFWPIREVINMRSHGKKRIRVWWEGDATWYTGTVVNYSRLRKRHQVHYDDGCESARHRRLTCC